VTSRDEKVWNKPKLRVFVRTRTEETVLGDCKLPSILDAATTEVGCRKKGMCWLVCYDIKTS